jgi:DNA-directed RNA polymerase subunit RPC12/RpoP
MTASLKNIAKSLQNTYPQVAAEACGWNPSLFSYGSKKKMLWQCQLGHQWLAAICNRTGRNSGCPYCSGRLPITGKSDLLTSFPSVAAEACGWNPSEYTSFSGAKKPWQCSNGHQWNSTIADRTHKGRNCPYCNGSKLIKGVNDLLTKFPAIAAEACGWDPSLVKYGSKQEKEWICSDGHIYKATVNHRTNMKSGCSLCATYGFHSDRPAWMYLMERAFDQQIGITNAPQTRIPTHKRDGWMLVEMVGPAVGAKVQELEATVKRWLKANNLRIEGTHENWRKDSLTVASLAEIAALAGVDEWESVW